MARFDQVKGVSDEDRDQAWSNILAAAKHYDVAVAETDWRQLGKRPHTRNPAVTTRRLPSGRRRKPAGWVTILGCMG